MKIAALALHSNAGWPDARVSQLDAGLNVFHGPPASGKTAIADLVAHALSGRRFRRDETADAATTATPEGELIVESGDHRFRLRRSNDETGASRLTVAALDETPVDRDTVHNLVYGLAPSLLGPIYALNFRESLRPETLLSPAFAQEFRAAFGGAVQPATPQDELAPIYARIRALETELTTLIAALGYQRRRRRPVQVKRQVSRTAGRASKFLAAISDGELRQIRLRRRSRGVWIVDRTGAVGTLGDISPAQRDQVYLSLSLALVSACADRGVQLPLVLDEPFVRFDRRRAATLARVLDTFGRRGHQVLVFTARQEVAEHFAELGSRMHDMLTLSQHPVASPWTVVADAQPHEKPATTETVRRTERTIRKKRRRAG